MIIGQVIKQEKNDVTLLNPIEDIEERINKLDKEVNKTIRAIRANMINKRKKFRIKHCKSYYGRI